MMRKRNMLKSLPFELRCEINERIHRMNPQDETEERDKIVLYYIFIQGMSTTELAQSNMPELVGRNHSPISRRRIQQIIEKYVPEYSMKNRNIPEKKNKAEIAKRRELARENWSEYVKSPKHCAICGCADNLQLDHSTPISVCPHKSNDPTNLIWLCESCHREKTLREVAQRKFNDDVLHRFVSERDDAHLSMIQKCIEMIGEQAAEIAVLKHELARAEAEKAETVAVIRAQGNPPETD